MNPLISVVIPIYQVKEYLEQCLESVIGQTYKNLEIILVDDGSTDGSGDLCDKFANKDNRIRVIHKENGGLSSARNVGIDVSKGEYISFIDSDDWIDERYIEELYRLCVDNDCDIAQCVHWDIWSEVNIHADKLTKAFVFSPRELAYAFDSLELWQTILAWNKLYKIELFEEIRYPEGRIHEDEYTSYKLTWKANKIAVTYSKLYYYRRCRANSIKTAKYSYKRLDCDEAYVQKENFYELEGEHELSLLTSKRHLKWLNQQIAQIKNSDLEDKDVVIKRLEEKAVQIEEILVNENVEYKKSAFHGFLFPFGLIPANCNMVLYGGGNVGAQFFRQVTTTNYCNIIAWVDKNSDACNKKGLPTKNVQLLSEMNNDYDYLVIAIENKKVSNEIIEELQRVYKVDKEKIIYQVDYF